jgi:hypothetical protein
MNRTGHSRTRRIAQILRTWPKCLVMGGAVLYAAGCLNIERLPVEALFVGPGMMLAGIGMMAAKRH